MGQVKFTGQAGSAALSVPMVAVLFRLAEWHRRRIIRKSCGALSDTLLRDIGLTPDDVEQALAQSMQQDASECLAKVAAARAVSW